MSKNRVRLKKEPFLLILLVAGMPIANADTILETIQRASRGLERSIGRNDSMGTFENGAGQTIPLNLRLLDQTAPKSRLGTRPWASFPFPMTQGLIAARYLDPGFLRLGSFSARNAYVKNRPLEVIARGDTWFSQRRSLDRLSPAEKYDLLVGDLSGTLTNAIWNEGERYEKNGGIASWVGICDGSSAASALAPEPVRDLVLRDPIFGNEFTLYASDIKALASLHYSEYVVKTPIVGGRCESSGSSLPPAGSSPSCESLNPASWHRAILFFNGIRNTPLFIDTSPNLEVWNTPVISYSMEYFDVRNSKAVESLDQALIKRSDFQNDPRASSRAPTSQLLVGVRMMISTSSGAARSTSGPQPATPLKRAYEYELELDGFLNLVGGEWLSKERPDFAWLLLREKFPSSSGDEELQYPQWTGGTIPADWRPAIQRASARVQTTGAIIRHLLEQSSK
jgi:hypothetical protein